MGLALEEGKQSREAPFGLREMGSIDPFSGCQDISFLRCLCLDGKFWCESGSVAAASDNQLVV